MPRTATSHPRNPRKSPDPGNARRLPGFDDLSKPDQRAVEHLFSGRFKTVDHPKITTCAQGDEALLLAQADAVPQAAVVWSGILRSGAMQSDSRHLTQTGERLTEAQEHALFLAFNLCRRRAIERRDALSDLTDHDRVREMLDWYGRAMIYRERVVWWFGRLIARFMVSGYGAGRHPIRRRIPEMTNRDIALEAALSLIEAVDRFDWTQGARFTTYAFGRMTGRFDHQRKAWYAKRNGQRVLRAPFADERLADPRDADQHGGDHDVLVETLRRIVAANLAGLTDDEKRALRCRFSPGSVAGACLMLRISADAVVSLVASALAKLRVALERIVYRREPTPREMEHIRQTVERTARGEIRLSPAGEFIMSRARAIGIESVAELADRIGYANTRKFISQLRFGGKVNFWSRTWEALGELLRIDPDELREAMPA